MLDYVNERVLIPGLAHPEAHWRCGLDDAPAGYSTYSQNAVEACWNKLRAVTVDGDLRQGVTAVFKIVAKDVQLWATKNEFADFVFTPPSPIPSSSSLRS